MPFRRFSCLFALLLHPACSAEAPEAEERTIRSGTYVSASGLRGCGTATEGYRCYTQRAVLGISMGAEGAGRVAFGNPDLFDTVAMLGAPMVDWAFTLRTLTRGTLGGFCPLETILDNLPDIDNPDGAAFCGPVAGTVALESTRALLEPSQDFNHWYRGSDNGRGGRFGRNQLREAIMDIALAFGNPFSYNPESPYYPPGVDPTDSQRPAAERCSEPATLKGFHHHLYNPDGLYDVIVPCDTQTNAGDTIVGAASRPFEILLAVDYNGNGRRDYAEPVLRMTGEPFSDTGNGDATPYDWQANPAATAHNGLHDKGEPYDDHGLDGVPDTGDYGENNGRYDLNPNVARLLRGSPRALLRGMHDDHLGRFNIYADAGIRDFLVSAGATNHLWADLQIRASGAARVYEGFAAVGDGTTSFDVATIDASPDGLGRHVYLRYGDVNATPQAIEAGDGQHVGTSAQAVQRFLLAFHFIQDRFHGGDRNAYDTAGEATNLVRSFSFSVPALDGRSRDYTVALPPGYDAPENQGIKYPVLYVLHGQGQGPSSLAASSLLFLGRMSGSNDTNRMRDGLADWAKFIIVYADSRCEPGLCDSGNFNANHQGIDGEGPRYYDAFFDLVQEVETRFRVAAPVEVPI